MQEPSAPTPRTTADGPTHAQWQALVVQALQAVLPPEGLLWTGEQTTPYECDGLTAYRQRPLAVALPATPAKGNVFDTDVYARQLHDADAAIARIIHDNLPRQARAG